MTLFIELERVAIPVSYVYGWVDNPGAYVMDRIAGQSEFAGSTAQEKRAALDEYLRILAQVHRLDVEPFAAMGIMRARQADA
jgi:aminoglycoside phosphotransferase (APT) family kinase protein